MIKKRTGKHIKKVPVCRKYKKKLGFAEQILLLENILNVSEKLGPKRGSKKQNIPITILVFGKQPMKDCKNTKVKLKIKLNIILIIIIFSKIINDYSFSFFI